jgi:hypothetical protein
VIQSVFLAAWQAARQPQVFLPTAAATVGSHLAYRALDADRGFWVLPQSSMALLALVVIARSWVTISVMGTALAVLRGRAPRHMQWVPPTTAFEVAVVAIGLAIPTLACLLFLIVPGIWLALRWSQTTMLVIDGQAAWFESADASARLTHGRRLEILTIWTMLGCGLLVIEWLMAAPFLPLPAVWAVRLATTTFLASVLAAIYFELERTQ